MNRFRLLERIGSGGMGTVYRAFDERLQRQVAVKEIQIAGADRVLREAQASARLNHPAIVTLYELGERDGHALLVSELVQGQTLNELCAAGSISDLEVGEFGSDICDALSHAHSRGVVHRDVKPQNVIVDDLDGPMTRAKLMDFGIASVAGAPTLTVPGSVVGTLAYMAPEQAEGDPCGTEADVYSLGLTLYEAWAGRNPVAADNAAQTARRIGRRQPSLADFRPDLPGELIAELDACLEPDPRDRPELEELQVVLRHCAGELDSEAAVPRTQAEDRPPLRARAAPRVAALALAGAALAIAAGPGALPGAALVIAALAFPALFVARSPLAAAAPLMAIPTGALGALLVVPALVALVAHDLRERLVLGATAFAIYLSAALAFGTGPTLGIAPPPATGWEHSAAEAASGVIGALADPAALLAIAICGLAAAALGRLLESSLPVALLGCAVWAAALETSLATVGNGSLGERPALALATAAAALIYEWRLRELAAVPAACRVASAQPALHGGG